MLFFCLFFWISLKCEQRVCVVCLVERVVVPVSSIPSPAPSSSPSSAVVVAVGMPIPSSATAAAAVPAAMVPVAMATVAMVAPVVVTGRLHHLDPHLLGLALNQLAERQILVSLGQVWRAKLPLAAHHEEVRVEVTLLVPGQHLLRGPRPLNLLLVVNVSPNGLLSRVVLHPASEEELNDVRNQSLLQRFLGRLLLALLRLLLLLLLGLLGLLRSDLALRLLFLLFWLGRLRGRRGRGSRRSDHLLGAVGVNHGRLLHLLHLLRLLRLLRRLGWDGARIGLGGDNSGVLAIVLLLFLLLLHNNRRGRGGGSGRGGRGFLHLLLLRRWWLLVILALFLFLLLWLRLLRLRTASGWVLRGRAIAIPSPLTSSFPLVLPRWPLGQLLRRLLGVSGCRGRLRLRLGRVLLLLLLRRLWFRLLLVLRSGMIALAALPLLLLLLLSAAPPPGLWGVGCRGARERPLEVIEGDRPAVLLEDAKAFEPADQVDGTEGTKLLSVRILEEEVVPPRGQTRMAAQRRAAAAPHGRVPPVSMVAVMAVAPAPPPTAAVAAAMAALDNSHVPLSRDNAHVQVVTRARAGALRAVKAPAAAVAVLVAVPAAVPVGRGPAMAAVVPLILLSLLPE
mmetsp:Transcript_1738/g.3939  ORF Transcript_1738/g.3939 Transcript_1738/m.3939 type:complete len:620 (-) Transcript_1738:165-2024(-)